MTVRQTNTGRKPPSPQGVFLSWVPKWGKRNWPSWLGQPYPTITAGLRYQSSRLQPFAVAGSLWATLARYQVDDGSRVTDLRDRQMGFNAGADPLNATAEGGSTYYGGLGPRDLGT